MDFNSFKYVVAGSGLFGSVIAERIASVLNQKVLIVEKRDHIGGNCYAAIDETTGIEYHVYGTHIFHTDNPVVWKYINRFTAFNTYRHQVLTQHNNKIYQLPINLETINSFYHCNLKPFEVDGFMQSITAKENVELPVNFEQKAISLLGRDMYEAFIKGYTIKQWQVDPAELDASVFNRLPFRKNYNENYYYDKWQGIPIDGYTEMFNKILNHPLISVALKTDYFDIRNKLSNDTIVVYSGPIDRFFDYSFGRLEWRTLRFEKEIVPVEDYQGNAVINFADPEVPYTRIHEPRHLHPERKYTDKKTVIFKEYSLKDSGDEPYYPLLTSSNKNMLQLYQSKAAQLQNTFISGRLGEYKYYDMDKTIERALHVFENNILPKAQSA